MVFPIAQTEAQWDRARTDDAALAAGVAAIAIRHGVTGRPVRRFAAGSVPVYALGDDLVLKLFAPFEAGFMATEAAALRALQDRLTVAPAPRVVAADVFEGWPYVLMTRCPGRPLDEVWDHVGRPQRIALMRAVGRWMAELHAVPFPDLGAAAWPDFVVTQRRTAADRQRRHGLDENWVAQIDGFLADHRPDDEPRVFLHTELMQAHLLVEADGAGWRLSGVIDFEPAMAGAAGYELSSVGLFVTEGDAELFGAVLDGYGREPRRGAALAERCLAFTLLHRYAKLPWYLERCPPPAEVTSLAELAKWWFDSAPR